MTGFVDSHVHLADPAFDVDRDLVIARSRDAGVTVMICIGESLAAAERAGAIASRHPGFIYHTAGVHPHDAADYDRDVVLPRLRVEVSRGAVAIGECGLDYHYDHSPRDRQRAAFADQLALAGELARPVVVHTREAEADTATMMDDAGRAGVRGVLHCFTGSIALAERALSVGWFISFSGIVTFRTWSDLELLRMVPDERLLVESDAPYLAPVPHRGRRNEPAWVSSTIARLAEVRGTETSRIAELTAHNARVLFGLA
ncbi:MAG: TatD family hydrolase [Gemmatimonadaceae bacterium]|nr:TatD family hydrolase [Gemmatimonadaceae bacterium]